jgi:outer membrane lipoprotein-sorting protein
MHPLKLITIKFFSISLLWMFVNVSLSLAQTTGMDIMRKYKTQMLTKDQSVNITMKIINKKGKERIRQITKISKTDVQENVSQLILFNAPADIKGTGLLSIEHSDRQDDRWLYLPALRRTRRISSTNRSDQFMGSDYTYEDIEPEKIQEFTYTLLGEEYLNNIECYKIEAVPNNQKTKDESGYSKRILFIDKERYFNYKTIFYDKKGTQIKVLRNEGFSLIEDTDKWRPESTVMNVMKEGETILYYDNYKINKGLKDNYFTKYNLERGIGALNL